MIRNTRLPSTDATANTRKMSSRRPASALRSANRGIATLIACRETLDLSGTPLALVGGDERGVHPVHHDGAVDHAARDVVAARQVVHHLEQHAFEDGAQTTGTSAALERLLTDRVERVIGEHELDVV